MFDIGAGELLVIGTVALIAIGPKELPGVLRSVGGMVGKLKRMAGEFRQQFDDAVREADLHEVQKTVSDTVQTASAATSFNPINTIRNEIKSTVDEIKGAGRAAEEDLRRPVEQGPPVSVLEPVPDVPVPNFDPPPAAAPALAEEPAPEPAKATVPRKSAKKTASGDAE